MNIFTMIKQKQYSKASKTMLQHVWKHPEGAQKDNWYSFVKFFHIFFDNKPSSTSTSTSVFGRCQNIMGITYLFHTSCPQCGYTNKMLYNSIFECHPNQLRQQDMTDGNITADIIINYRHHHSHELSTCPTCSSERYQWYSIVDVPLIFILNMEGIRTDTSSDITCTVYPPNKLSIDTVTGTISLNAWGQLHHHPGHWTAWSLSHVYSATESLCESVGTFYYNDINEKAIHKKFTPNIMSLKETSAVIYVRAVDGDGTDLCSIPYMAGFTNTGGRALLHCPTTNQTNVAEGYVVYSSIHGVCVVLITSVKQEYLSLPCPFIQTNRPHQPTTLGGCINLHAIWDFRYMTIPPDSTPDALTTTQSPHAPSTSTTTAKPRLKKRKQPDTVYVDDSTSHSSSYDLELERAKARSRREAQPLRSNKV